MDTVQFENENNTNYMLIHSHKQEGINDSSFEIKMLEKNKIHGLLTVSMRQINNSVIYYYEITAKQQITKIFSYNKIKWQDLKMLCEGISEMVHTINEYMLNLENVLLLPEFIYMDISKRQVYFTYYPCTAQHTFKQGGFDNQIQQLFEYILEHYDHNTNKEELMCVYDIYQKVSQNEYNIGQLGELVNVTFPDGKKAIESPVNEQEPWSGTYEKEEQDTLVDAVPCETIYEEKEVADKGHASMQKKIKIIAALCAVFGIICLLFPQIIPLPVNPVAALVLVAAGTAIYAVIDYFSKTALSKIEYSTYNQPYIISKEKSQSNNIDQRADLQEYQEGMQSGAAFETDTENAEKQQEAGKEEMVFGGQTMLLSEYMAKKSQDEVCVTLVYQGNASGLDKEIQIEHFPCMIGSLGKHCDIEIKSETISRIHMCIFRKDSQIYVEDMNSTNGTYINGIRISTGTKQLLVNGDELKLASFLYKVEIT